MGIASAAAIIALLAAAPAQAATISVNCATQDLQAKIDHAAAGSTLVITGTCHGNFQVGEDLTLKGTKSPTLDGDNAGSTLAITGTPTVHLIGLIVTGGQAAAGGGINKAGGRLTLDRVTVEYNLSSDPNARGGGIYSAAGALVLKRSSIIHNRALAFGSGTQVGLGGGVASFGPLTIISSVLDSNHATGISSDGQAFAVGGAVSQSSFPLIVRSSHLDGNHAVATGPLGVQATGGGLEAGGSPSLSISGSTLNTNTVIATGPPAADAHGGGLWLSIDHGTISHSTFAGNVLRSTASSGNATSLGGGIKSTVGKLTLISDRITGSQLFASGGDFTGAAGGGIQNKGTLAVSLSSISGGVLSAKGGTGDASATGGGIEQAAAGPLSVARTTIQRNRLISSGADSPGVTGGGGGIRSYATTSLVASTLSHNSIRVTSQGPNSAFGYGGGLDLEGPSDGTIKNSTLAANAIRAVGSKASGVAIAYGGGLYLDGDVMIVNTTIARNGVSRIGHTGSALGGGLRVNSGAVKLEGTILALNTAPPANGPDCFGNVSSGGHNLLGTKSGCTFTKRSTDKIGKDPKLGPLADNGGPTRTLALLLGSPAIDAIPNAACAVAKDQRGVSRPQGPRCDIGSYERKA